MAVASTHLHEWRAAYTRDIGSAPGFYQIGWWCEGCSTLQPERKKEGVPLSQWVKATAVVRKTERLRGNSIPLRQWTIAMGVSWDAARKAFQRGRLPNARKVNGRIVVDG